MAQLQAPTPNPVLDALKQQYDFLDVETMPHVVQLVEHEIFKLTQESMMKGPPPNPDYLDLSNEKNRIKISHNVIIPTERFPKILGVTFSNLFTFSKHILYTSVAECAIRAFLKLVIRDVSGKIT